ncbi:hypothetical protein IM40_06990 [Candidatus Paracaedimonas acanthamoebae]|nr:hypothetical protein IM40_06990 [Candidatus Paracaedimonas acanthamoebae]
MIKFRHFFSLVFIPIFLVFSTAFSSDGEVVDQPQKKSCFTTFPRDLFCEVAKHLLVPDILRATQVCKEWYQAFNQDTIWKNIAQTIPLYQHYKKLKFPAKRAFIKLMTPQFYFWEDLKIIIRLSEHHKKSARLWALLYGEEILELLLAKKELLNLDSSLKIPLHVSVTAFKYNIGPKIIAGKVQFDDQKLPFLYLEKKGIELWKNILAQAQILPVGYEAQKITHISEDSTMFTGIGSQSSLWIAYFPDVKSFERRGVKVFDYQQSLKNSDNFTSHVPQVVPQPNQSVGVQTTPSGS